MSSNSLLSIDFTLHQTLKHCKTVSQKRRLLIRYQSLKESYCELIDYINNNGLDNLVALDTFTTTLNEVDNVIELIKLHLYDVVEP